MPIGCIFVPDFPVEALLRSQPELRTQAVVVLDGKIPLQKVFARNEHARRAGVDIGMAKLEVEACNLTLRVRSPLQEAAAHAALLDCAQSFSPRVEDVSCDTILIDLAGLDSLFGPLPKLARDLARRASDLGLEANVAVASNPDTAVIAARGFSGVTVIAPGKEAGHLGSLPVEILFNEEDEEAQQLLETLSRWGIRNLRALAALPDIALSERLGQRGLSLQKLARGTTERTLVPSDLLFNFEEGADLEHPLMLLEPLAFLLSKLLDQLCGRLRARALATQELQLKLKLDRGCKEDETQSSAWTGKDDRNSICDDYFERTLHLPVPLLDPKIFLKLLQLDLNAHPPGAPILAIHLRAEPTRPRAAQGSLFLPPTPEPEKLELTLARIAGIVGEDMLGSFELLDTYRADGFRMKHFAAAGSHENLCRKSSDSTVTAMRIFRPPVRVAVTFRHGAPAHIACKKRDLQEEILWSAGPWRSSGDWWEQNAWSRDNWDIAVQSQTDVTLYRLAHDLLNGQWFLEGTYD